MQKTFTWSTAQAMRQTRHALTGAMIGTAAVLLAACSTTPTEAPPSKPVYTSPIPPDQMVGSWGLAAYHRPDDAARTETQARAQCSNPYVITAGSNGGVMMYLADDNKLTEVVSKTNGGATYIGPPEDEAGGMRDRQVVRIDSQVMTLKWVDPEVSKRYGTMVYVRCK